LAIGLSSWTRLIVDHGNTPDTRDLAFDPSTNTPRFVTSDGGVHRSTDGQHFTFVGGPRHGLDADQVTEVTGQYVPGRAEPELYFTTQHNNVWSMLGETVKTSHCCEGFFIRLPARSAGVTTNRVTYTACGPCGNYIADIHMEHDDNWHSPEPGVGAPQFLGPNKYVQAVDSNNGFSAGIKYTPDEGASWRQLAYIPQPLLGLPQVAGPTTNPTLIQPYSAGPRSSDGRDQVRLVLLSGFISEGGRRRRARYALMNDFGGLGVTSTAFASYWVFAADPTDPARIIAVDDLNGDVRKSMDGGDNWTSIPDLARLTTLGGRIRFSIPGNGPNISTISICPYNNSRLLMGTRQGGAYFSFDGGDSWTAVSDSDPIVYATSIFWLDGCAAAYMSTYARGIWRIEMTLRPETVFPQQPCVLPEVCRLRDLLRGIIGQPHGPGGAPGPGLARGLIVSDGFITSVKQHGGSTSVRVTPGSVLTYYQGMPAGLKVTYARTSPRGVRRFTQALLFVRGRLVRTVRGDAALRLHPLPLGRVGHGRATPNSTSGATIEVESKIKTNGNAYSVVEVGMPLVVHGFVRKPSGDPLVLQIDGQDVAKFSAGSRKFDFVDKKGPGAIGVHSVRLARMHANRRSFIGLAQFVVSNGDVGEGAPKPPPPPPPPPPPGPSSSLAELTLDQATVRGGSTANGTVKLTASAPAGGATVTLSSSDPAATVPPNVVVAAGATSASFVVSTSNVATQATVTISASYGGVTRSATLTVTPAPAKFNPSLKASVDQKADTLSISGSGWDPCGNPVTLTLKSKGVTQNLGTVKTDGAGNFSATFSKTGASPGDTVQGAQATCASGETISAAANVS
jgi:hypothetical protein